MVADASIYGQIKAPVQGPGPLEQYGQVESLRSLMGQRQLQELQRTKLTEDMAEERAGKDYLKALAPGVSPTSDESITGLMRIAPKRALELQKAGLDATKTRGDIAHTAAQTGNINAGHIAGAMASIAKGGGSDASIQAAQDMMTPIIGADGAAAATEKLKALPPEMRLAYVVAQAGTHKTGQEALKLFFPDAKMQDTGGSITPVNTGTIPGGPAPGAVVPGAVPIVKTQTPDSAATDARTAKEGDLNRRMHYSIAAQNDARARELNGIMEGQAGADLTPTATAIANHDIPLPSPPSGSRNPMAMVRYNDLLKKVKEINPTYNAPDYAASLQAVKSFGDGKSGQAVQSANTAMNHLATLQKLAEAQKNGNMQLFNKLANEYGAQTGQTAPTDLRAALTMVAPEIVKAVVGAGGGVEDREKAAKALNPNYSPAQFLGATNGMKELFAGRLSEAERTYERTTFRKDFRTKLLSPAAAEILGARGGSGTTAAPSSSGWSVVK